MESCPRVLLTFGDSSGNPSRSKKGYEDSAHYIIVTATMDAREAQRVDAQVEGLKAKYFGGINPERVSFHSHRLLHNLIRHTGNRRLAEQKLKEVFEDIVEIIQGMESTLNVVVMDKRFPREDYKASSTITVSWAHASDMIRSTMLKSPLDTIGITVLDRYDDPTNRIVANTVIRSLAPPPGISRSTVLKTMPRPMFVNAVSCNMVQLMDMIASIVAKHNVASPAMFAHSYARIRPHISHISYLMAE